MASERKNKPRPMNVHFRNRGGGGVSMGNRGFDMIPTMGMIFMNPVSGLNMGIGEDWDITEIMTSPTLKGLNWEMYYYKLLSMGYHPDCWHDTTISGQPAFQVGGSPHGEAALALASLFDKVALGHWPSNNCITMIRNLAASQGRAIEIGNYFLNLETINQAVELSAAAEAVRVPVKAYLITGTGNATGFLTAVTIANGGSGYAIGDTITLAGGTVTTRTILYVSNVSGGAVTAVIPTTSGAYGTPPGNPVAQFSTTGIGTGATFNVTWNTTCTKVDQFETVSGLRACAPTDAASFTTHTWYADCSDLSGDLAAELGVEVTSVFENHYTPQNRPAFIIVDNGLDRPNWAGATNEPSVLDATYVTFYGESMGALIAALAPTKVWSNRGEVGVATYTALNMPYRYGEFYLHLDGNPGSPSSKTLATLQTELTAAKTNGILIALDHGRKGGEVDLWATSTGPGGSKGTWLDLKNHMNTGGLRNNMIAMALRTSSAFYAHWQVEFGVM